MSGVLLISWQYLDEYQIKKYIIHNLLYSYPIKFIFLAFTSANSLCCYNNDFHIVYDILRVVTKGSKHKM